MAAESGKDTLRTRTLKEVTNLHKKAVHLPFGVVLFKNCLNEKQQMELLDTCLMLTNFGGNEKLLPKHRYTSKSRNAIPLLFYNWPGHPDSFSAPKPVDLLDFGQKVFKEALQCSRTIEKQLSLMRLEHKTTHKQTDKLSCPNDFEPNALYAILYPYDGRFGAHLDGAKGWVLSISIGHAAKFFYSEKYQGEKTFVQLDSGDVLLFNGGQLYHGIEEIIPNSAPAFWTSPQCGMSVYDMGRFNLQFRDSIRDKLSYNPIFPEEGQRDDWKLNEDKDSQA